MGFVGVVVDFPHDPEPHLHSDRVDEGLFAVDHETTVAHAHTCRGRFRDLMAPNPVDVGYYF